tara:strand:- start:506 stop:1447 length:942 start_codon:yes stop_codon:yes gene_type:complete
MIENFTLLVPVRDRHYNLKGICSYYKDLDCKKIIVDSSISPFKNIDLIKSSGFDYVYYGPTKYINKMHRIYNELINTEFSLDCSDDDIVLKEAIKESVAFLKSNDDYSACDGENLWLNKRNMHVFEKRPNKFFGPLKANFRSSRAIDRVAFDFNCCMTKQHSVIRTNVALKTWNTLKDCPPLQPMAFIERFHVFVTAIMGNSKKLPLVYSVRNESDDRMIHRKDIQNETQDHILFINNLDQEHLKPFVDLLMEHTEGLSYEEGFNFFHELIKSHLEGGSDLCHINTDNWSFRSSWSTSKYNSQIEEAVKAMML